MRLGENNFKKFQAYSVYTVCIPEKLTENQYNN